MLAVAKKMNKMVKRHVLVFMLKLINLLMIICAVSMVVLGAFYLTKWKENSHASGSENSQMQVSNGSLPVNPNQLQSVWFFYLLFAIGATLCLIACLGLAGTRTRNPCCLSSYSILLLVLVLSELVTAALILSRKSLNEDLLNVDKDGKFRPTYHFIQENWKTMRWIILVALVLEVVALVLALNLWTKRGAVYDSSDDEANDHYAPERRCTIMSSI